MTAYLSFSPIRPGIRSSSSVSLGCEPVPRKKSILWSLTTRVPDVCCSGFATQRPADERRAATQEVVCDCYHRSSAGCLSFVCTRVFHTRPHGILPLCQHAQHRTHRISRDVSLVGLVAPTTTTPAYHRSSQEKSAAATTPSTRVKDIHIVLVFIRTRSSRT